MKSQGERGEIRREIGNGKLNMGLEGNREGGNERRGKKERGGKVDAGKMREGKGIKK